MVELRADMYCFLQKPFIGRYTGNHTKIQVDRVLMDVVRANIEACLGRSRDSGSCSVGIPVRLRRDNASSGREPGGSVRSRHGQAKGGTTIRNFSRSSTDEVMVMLDGWEHL